MNVQRFRGGLFFKAHRLCVSLNSRLTNLYRAGRGCTGAVGAGRPLPRPRHCIYEYSQSTHCIYVYSERRLIRTMVIYEYVSRSYTNLFRAGRGCTGHFGAGRALPRPRHCIYVYSQSRLIMTMVIYEQVEVVRARL